MRAPVDLQCPDAKDVSRLLRRLSHAPQDCPDAQHELLRAEWLGQIVVGSERKAANPILLLFPRGEHEHGDIARRIVGSQLLEIVWESAPDIQTRTVDMHVQRLRAKLGAAGEMIETVRGFGYRLRRAVASER